MKILYNGYAANNHSWGIVAQNFCRQFINLGHQVDIFSTNGIEYMPNDLKPFVIGNHKEFSTKNPGEKPKIEGKEPEKKYDMVLSYTYMANFGKYTQYTDQNKFVIWCYEWESFLPPGTVKFSETVDYLFPPSKNSFDIFEKGGVKTSKMSILPHGVEDSFYNQKDLNLSNNIKYLSVFASNDGRKNIYNMFETWCKAFKKSDNVTWIIKTTKKSEKELNSYVSLFKNKYKNMADIRILSKYMDNIQDIYKSCDIYFCMSHCEGFLMPGLEAVLSNMPVVSPNYGGQLDYLNENNSYLIDGQMAYSPKGAAYYSSDFSGAKWFDPVIEHAVQILRESKKTYKDKKELMLNQHDEYKEKYAWSNIAKTMLGYCK